MRKKSSPFGVFKRQQKRNATRLTSQRRERRNEDGRTIAIPPRAGLNSERLSNNDYPIGEVVLGIELRGHGAKGAIIDTANGDFMRPGVEVALDELNEEAVEEALTKIANHYNWAGAVGVSYTRADANVRIVY